MILNDLPWKQTEIICHFECIQVLPFGFFCWLWWLLHFFHEKRWAGRSTSWNQDCWQKYQSPQICRWHHPYGRKWRETKESLDECERVEGKTWLKTQHSKHEDHGIQSHHFMANRWGKVQTVTDFIFLGFKITVDSDCHHEIKRSLLLGRKAMTNLDSILKSRDIILLTKVHIVKAMVFPVVMNECETWTIKAEHWRTDAFKLWCWRRLLRFP